MRILHVCLIYTFSFLGLFGVPSGMLGQQASPSSQAKKGLSNDDVISMARVRFPDSTIIKAISRTSKLVGIPMKPIGIPN
jgi:hypothetical protein